MKRIINLFIILMFTTVSVFSADLKGKEIGDNWILSGVKGKGNKDSRVEVVSKKSEDGKVTFSIANVDGQLVAIVTDNTYVVPANVKVMPVAKELQVVGLDGNGYKNNAMLIGNNYFQYLEYWQILNLNIDKIKIITKDRLDKEISGTIDMKGYINAIKKVYSGGKNTKGQDKYTGYTALNDEWMYKETPEYKEISKEFMMIEGMDKDYGQLRNRVVIRNYNGVLWGGLLLARPFDMRAIPEDIELYTEKSKETAYVVSPVGSLDGKQQNVKMAITENAIKEMKASKFLVVDVIPSKEGDFYTDDADLSQIDLAGFTKALEKLGKYRVVTVEDLK